MTKIFLTSFHIPPSYKPNYSIYTELIYIFFPINVAFPLKRSFFNSFKHDKVLSAIKQTCYIFMIS